MSSLNEFAGGPAAESVFDIGARLTQLLADASQEAVNGQLPMAIRDRVADLAECIRRRTAVKAERDPRTLFDLDERFVELMERTDEEASESGAVSAELLQEITEYLEAFRGKVDRIASYWRWQESIAKICAEEVDRLSARRKSAEARVTRLKNMLISFMLTREQKKLDGDKASIALQPNGNPSVVIDDPLQLADSFRETQLSFTKTELQEITYQLAEGEIRRRLEFVLVGEDWQINTSAVRAALVNGAGLTGARLAKGHHVRIR